MKKLLLVLFTLMAATSAFADPTEQTAPPVIDFIIGQDYYYVVVHGDGLLSVTITASNGDVLDSQQSYMNYEYQISRSDVEGFDAVTIEATAQDDEMLVSEVVTMTQSVHGYIPMPEPLIEFAPMEGYGHITVTAPGSVLVDIIIEVDGDVVCSDYTYDTFEYDVVQEDFEKYIQVTATAVPEDYSYDGFLPTTVSETFVLDALFQPQCVAPYIEVNVTQEDVEVYAVCFEDGGVVHLFKDGAEVQNPCSFSRSYNAGDCYFFSAYCEAPGMQPSEWVYREVVIPVHENYKTSAPTISCTVQEDGHSVLVVIEPTEPSDIYYRVGIYDYAYEDFNMSDWLHYDSPLLFNADGLYLVEAYAQAYHPDYDESERVCLQFAIASPTPGICFDFEENGIFYELISNDKVSVCSEMPGYASYHGEVVIPATVTHDGTTYMVTGISESAFHGCTGLTGVTIGAYVTAIGDGAFQGCTSLTSVTLGDYVISVGEQAFAGCSGLQTVKMGSGLARIGAQAFHDCSALTSVYCKAATPPVITTAYTLECYDTATLYVYPAVMDSYRTANVWSQFDNVVAEDSVAPAAGDTNGDGMLDITDITLLISKVLTGM